jgi:hypothetical protein
MPRAKLLFVLVLLACLEMLPHAAAAGAIRDYTGGILLDTEGGPPQGPCFTIRGWVAAPGFFDGLKGRETSRGAEFRRGALVVNSFPDELRIRLWVREFPCHVGLTEVSPLAATPEMMNSLRFEAFWKREMKMRPVETLALHSLFRRKGPPTMLADVDVTIQRDTWVYDLSVCSEDVPLTDHLILEIFGKGGERWARVSVRL